MKKLPFVGIAGNIGVGKTTFTEKVGQHFQWEEIYESVIDNPYLSDFYDDMSRWSFNLQIYFLHHRFGGQMELANRKSGVIQDRTIYEDVEIFARNLYEMKHMSKRDWDTYTNLFKNMTHFLCKPDLIIYLKASTDTIISRIKNRNRDFEKSISPEYLHSLNVSYNKWIKRINNIKVLTVHTDNFNIYTDTDKFNDILVQIERKLSE
jgi:deoxyadenosine/deoxycytidine kinase